MKGLGTRAVIHGLLRKRVRDLIIGGRLEEGLRCDSRWFDGPELLQTRYCAGSRIFSDLTRGFEVHADRDSKNDEGEREIIRPEYRFAECPLLQKDNFLRRSISFQIPYNFFQRRNYRLMPLTEGGRWMRVLGAYSGPLSFVPASDPFRDGSVRFKSRKKQKKAKQKKREVLSKIKRIRVATKKRKEDMTPEELLEFRILKGNKKIELIDVQIAKFPVQELPPVDPDIEVLTPEQLHYLKKIGYKNKNYVPVGRRGVYGGTIQNIHLHWKKHETVQVEIAGFTREEIKDMAVQLERLSGGLVVDIHQGNVVILYRGRNYKQPKELIPVKTLDKRKALMKSKLEQSKKALILNQVKLEKELKQLRKDIALGFAVGAQPDGKAVQNPEVPTHRNLGPADKDGLQDPDSYGTSVEDDDFYYLSEVEEHSDLTSDSEGEDEEQEEEEDSDPEDLGVPNDKKAALKVKYRS